LESLRSSEPVNQPASHEIEVSLFGPGYGECVLVHLGLGEWLVVDSCVNQYAGGTPAIDYLRTMGVDIAHAVVMVTASHWHDDHIRGLSEIVDECKSAEFAMSLALQPKEFVQLVQAAGRDPMVTSSGVDEYFRILQTLVARKTADAQTIAPTWAVTDRRLWQRINGEPDAEIWSLAPSNESVAQSLQSFGVLLTEQQGTKKAVRPIRPNLATTVLWVRVGSCHVLLGGDLEETSSPGTGWTAIVD
jgi:hypothetical protein